MSISSASNKEIFNLYRKEIFLLYGTAIFIFIITFLVISKVESPGFAIHWLIQSMIVLVIVFFQTVSRLDKNRLDDNSTHYNSLGWGNRLTIVRGMLIAALAGFVFQSWPVSILIWIPGIIYTIAAVIDRIDGYLARITGMQSQFGEELDTVYDAIGLLIAPLLAIGYGQVHWSFLLVSISYYAFVLGISFRKHRGLTVNELPPNISRRAIAGFQMGYIAAVLLPVFHPPITQLAGVAFMVPLLVGFVIDWFTVCGSLINGSKIVHILDRLKMFGINTLLPVLRVLSVILAIRLFLTINPMTIGDSQSNWLVITSGIALTLILTGIITRIGAVILAITMGIYYQYQNLTIDAAILLVCTIWIMMLGAGRFSLYKWDEDWVNRYDGK